MTTMSHLITAGGQSLPDGGVSGDALIKQSATDGDADWQATAALSNDDPASVGVANDAGGSPEAARADHVHKRKFGNAGSGVATGYRMFPNVPGSASNTQFALNQLRLVPIFFDVDVVLDRIGQFLSTAGDAGALARFGIYSSKDSVGWPTGTPLVDTGTTSAEVQDPEPTINESLLAGKYWLGYVSQGMPVTAPTVFAHNASTSPMLGMPGAVGSHLQAQNGLYVAGVSGALPDLSAIAPTAAGMDGIVPLICVRVASYTPPA